MQWDKSFAVWVWQAYCWSCVAVAVRATQKSASAEDCQFKFLGACLGKKKKKKNPHTRSERQWIEMWLLSSSKCSINTLAFLKPWQSHCYKLTRLSNFPSWNKSFLMYFLEEQKEVSTQWWIRFQFIWLHSQLAAALEPANTHLQQFVRLILIRFQKTRRGNCISVS